MTDLKKYVVDEIIGGFALNPLVALKEVISANANLKRETKKTKKTQNKTKTNKNPPKLLVTLIRNPAF